MHPITGAVTIRTADGRTGGPEEADDDSEMANNEEEESEGEWEEASTDSD